MFCEFDRFQLLLFLPSEIECQNSEFSPAHQSSTSHYSLCLSLPHSLSPSSLFLCLSLHSSIPLHSHPPSLPPQLSMSHDKTPSVQLLLFLPSGTVDLNDEVYTSDVKIGESLSFTLNSAAQGVPPEGPIPIYFMGAVKEVTACNIQ